MSRHFSESEEVGCNDIVVITHQEHQQAMKTRTAEADIVTQIMADSDDVNNDKVLVNPSTTTSATTTNGVRRRALSMAETQPTVETVVVKAKRAAQSLWMLLHAQSCTLGQRCPHTGCQEAKLLHLHLKTCNAGPNGECPMLYHGCDQSRKLLAHYRRCRSLRARQAGSGIGKQQHPSLSHHCLVCSLVARQARTMLERSSPPSMSGSVFKSSTTNVKKGSSTSSVSLRKVSYVLSAGEADVLNGVSSISNRNVQPNSAMKMPPPPPRTSMITTSNSAANGDVNGGSSSDLLARLYATAKQLDTDDPADSAPSQTQRERSVSDTEMLDHTVVSMNGDDTNNLVLTGAVDTDFHRMRSASCGSKPVASINVSLSPCETILEEEL